MHDYLTNYCENYSSKFHLEWMKWRRAISFRFCVLQILLQDCFEDPSGTSLWLQKLSTENYHSNEINSCFPPRLKSANNVHDREKRLTTSHVKTLCTCISGANCESSYYAKYICFTFSLYHSSVSDKKVAFEVCRWSRIHSFSQKFSSWLYNQKYDH